MTIISLSSIKKQHRVLIILLMAVFCSMPFQHRITGIFKAFSLSIIPSNLHLPGHFSTKIGFYLSDLCLIVFLVAALFYLRSSWENMRGESPFKFLVFLAITGFISLFFSKTGHYPLQYIRLFQLSFSFLFFSLIVGLCQRLDRVGLIATLSSALLSIGLFESGIALYQYFTQHAVGLKSLGELKLTHFPFCSGGSPLYWGGKSSGAEFLFRASGTFSHPNILGMFLFCSLFATCYLYLQKQVSNLCLVFLIGAQQLALVTSFSRSALLALLCGGILFFLLLLKSPLPLKRSLFLLGTLFTFCVAALLFLSPALCSRGGILNYNQTVQGADLERVYYSKMAIDMIKHHPFLGVGFNNFQLYASPLQDSMPGHVFHSKVHNIYLLVASEMGLIGFLFFLCFLIKVVRAGSKGLLSQREVFTERVFLLTVFVGCMLIGCFDFFLLFVPVASLLFFGLAAFLYSLSERKSEQGLK